MIKTIIKKILMYLANEYFQFRLLPERVTQQHKLSKEDWEERITNW